MRLEILLIPLFLAGCSSIPTVQTVKVAIPVKCTFEPIEPPIEYFGRAKVSDSLYDKVKFLLAEREERIAYEMQLIAALVSCASPVEVPTAKP